MGLAKMAALGMDAVVAVDVAEDVVNSINK
jgi:hypothetical protein